MARLARDQLAADPAPTREGPRRHHDGLPVGVVEGVLGEPGLHEVDQLSVVQRVPDAGGDVVDAWFARTLGRPLVGCRVVGCRVVGGKVHPGHGEDGGGHEVDGDDVDHPLGDAGELAQQAPGIGDDDGLGHAETADPAGARLGQRRLDDRRPHDGHGELRRVLANESLLAESLGVRVGIGPAQ